MALSDWWLDDDECFNPKDGLLEDILNAVPEPTPPVVGYKVTELIFGLECASCGADHTVKVTTDLIIDGLRFNSVTCKECGAKYTVDMERNKDGDQKGDDQEGRVDDHCAP